MCAFAVNWRDLRHRIGAVRETSVKRPFRLACLFGAALFSPPGAAMGSAPRASESESADSDASTERAAATERDTTTERDARADSDESVGGDVARKEDAAESEHSGGHGHYANAVAMQVAYVRTSTSRSEPELGEEASVEASEGPEIHSALRIAIERVLVEGWLQVELATLLSSAPGGAVEFPTSLALKLPFELSEHVEAYAGAGMAFELEHELEEWTPVWGVAAAAGMYLWFSSHMGLNVNLEHAWFMSDGLTSELAAAVGVALRF
jgi:hypothetical protein